MSCATWHSSGGPPDACRRSALARAHLWLLRCDSRLVWPAKSCLLTAPDTPHSLQTCTAERLGQLNAESAACIATWQVAVRHSQELGRFLVSGTGVPAGHTVLVLPPNRILRFEHVDDFNTVIQARQNRPIPDRPAGCAHTQLRTQVRASESQAGRLYSASLTPDDLDNFLSHSCV